MKTLSGETAHRTLKDKIDGLRHVSVLALVNAEGKVFNWSASWPADPIDVSDRYYFKLLKSESGRTSYLSRPERSWLNGAWAIFLARKLTAADGAIRLNYRLVAA